MRLSGMELGAVAFGVVDGPENNGVDLWIIFEKSVCAFLQAPIWRREGRDANDVQFAVGPRAKFSLNVVEVGIEVTREMGTINDSKPVAHSILHFQEERVRRRFLTKDWHFTD